jgi:choline dehydrogenase-like flavoprotein
MKTAVVIGAGAGGATAAKELQGKFNVTLLDAGAAFRPFAFDLSILEKLRSTRLFLSEKMIGALYPVYRTERTRDGMVLVSGRAVGGTTGLTCGNAVRVDDGLAKIGINLAREFSELESEIGVTTDHRHLWKKTTNDLFEICKDEGLGPFGVPKAGDYKNCRNCGHCTLGCPFGVKWDASAFVREARDAGARVVQRCVAKKITFEGRLAAGVVTNRGFFAADVVVVAAGGLGTPPILENSGIPTEQRLFVDPVLCVAAAYENACQNTEIPMPFAVQMDGFIIAPYFDYLSFFFNPKWRKPGKDILSLMIKLADEPAGSLRHKTLTARDRRRLDEGVRRCRRIFQKLGVEAGGTFLGTLNAGHPGGMLPLTEREAETLHHGRLPRNVYVADSSLLPASLGNPPMLTIMALARKIARVVIDNAGA